MLDVFCAQEWIHGNAEHLFSQSVCNRKMTSPLFLCNLLLDLSTRRRETVCLPSEIILIAIAARKPAVARVDALHSHATNAQD